MSTPATSGGLSTTVADPARSARYSRHSSPGMTRRMNRSKEGTVKAVSPRAALQIIPLAISCARVGPSAVTFLSRARAISPERCGPGPSSAMAPQVALLGRRQSVEAGAEEARVQGGRHLRRCTCHVAGVDGRALRDVPYMLAPLLQEVGIAPGLLDDGLQGVGGDIGIARPDWVWPLRPRTPSRRADRPPGTRTGAPRRSSPRPPVPGVAAARRRRGESAAGAGPPGEEPRSAPRAPPSGRTAFRRQSPPERCPMRTPRLRAPRTGR